MKTVQRGNKQLRVADDRLEDMLKSGYIEVDGKTGKPLVSPGREPDAASLKRDNTALKKENAALKKANEELRAQVEAMTAKPAG